MEKNFFRVFVLFLHATMNNGEIMNNFQVMGVPKAHRMLVGKEADAIVDKAINALLEAIMNEPNNRDD